MRRLTFLSPRAPFEKAEIFQQRTQLLEIRAEPSMFLTVSTDTYENTRTLGVAYGRRQSKRITGTGKLTSWFMNSPLPLWANAMLE